MFLKSQLNEVAKRPITLLIWSSRTSESHALFYVHMSRNSKNEKHTLLSIKFFTLDMLKDNTSKLFYNQHSIANTTWTWALRH